MFWQCRDHLLVQLLLGEHVSELDLEDVVIVECGGALGALQMEPQDAIHVALVRQHFIFNGLLHQAAHIVLFKSIALVTPLYRWLVKKVHFLLL